MTMAGLDFPSSLSVGQDSSGAFGRGGDSEQNGNVCTTNISPDDLLETAQAYRRRDLKLGDGEIDPGAVCEALGRQKPKKLFSPTRRKAYLQQFTSAYVLSLVIERSEIGPAIAQQLRDEQGIRRKGDDDPALLALRSRFDYSSSDEEEQRQGRSQLSRDAGSLRYLQEQNVSPDDVIALSKKRGEGVAQWYARYRESRRRSRQATSAEPGTEAAVKGQLAIALVQLDGPTGHVVVNQFVWLARGEPAETVDALWLHCVEFLSARPSVEAGDLAEAGGGDEATRGCH